MQRILVPLFIFFWWKRLYVETIDGRNIRRQVVEVKNWRSAIVDEPGYERTGVSFCFNNRILKKVFK